MSDEIRSLYYQAKLKAVENILNDDDLSFYKRITRWYSTTFSTPLQEVRTKISFPQILQEYYESTMEDVGFNDVYEYTMRDMLPEFMVDLEKDDEAFAKSLEEEQERNMESKKRRDMKIKDEQTIEIEEEVLPTEKQSPKTPDEINLTFDGEDKP